MGEGGPGDLSSLARLAAPMRARVLVAVLVLLLAPTVLAGPVEASIDISAPTWWPAGWDVRVTGRLTTRDVGIPNEQVDVLVDGVRAASASTSATGAYDLKLRLARGPHTLTARADTLLGAPSVTKGHSAAGPPGAPSNLLATPASTPWNGVRLTWDLPDDGGAPVLRSTIERSEGGAWASVGTTTTREFVDATALSAHDYAYRIRAENIWFAGAWGAVEHLTPDAPPATEATSWISLYEGNSIMGYYWRLDDAVHGRVRINLTHEGWPTPGRPASITVSGNVSDPCRWHGSSDLPICEGGIARTFTTSAEGVADPDGIVRWDWEVPRSMWLEETTRRVEVRMEAVVDGMTLIDSDLTYIYVDPGTPTCGEPGGWCSGGGAD